ncbi:hypothetical protein COOONC_16948 [Cooperia oncophora]
MVEAALLGDPDNEELKKLKADLEEVIALQEELASTSASSSAHETARVAAPAKKYERVRRQFVESSASQVSAFPDTGKKNYVFDTRSAMSKTAANKKEWLAERERRRLRAQKKEMKRKELDLAKETEKNSWLKFNNKALTKGIKVCCGEIVIFALIILDPFTTVMLIKLLKSVLLFKGMKRVVATGSAQDGPAGGVKSQTIISSRANQFAFKSARGAMDSLF